jgi:hypothetical protein
VATITVAPSTPRTTSSIVPDNNTYLVKPGAVLTVAGGLGPNSVICDFGGTVVFATPPGTGPNHLDQGIVSLADGGFLVYAGMEFISPSTVPPNGGGEKIRMDDSSRLGIGNDAPAALPTLRWITNLDGFNPADPAAGSLFLTFGTQQFGIDVGLLFPPQPVFSKPPWSVYQPIPGGDIITPTSTVPMGVPQNMNFA